MIHISVGEKTYTVENSDCTITGDRVKFTYLTKDKTALYFDVPYKDAQLVTEPGTVDEYWQSRQK